MTYKTLLKSQLVVAQSKEDSDFRELNNIQVKIDNLEKERQAILGLTKATVASIEESKKEVITIKDLRDRLKAVNTERDKERNLLYFAVLLL